MKRFSTIACYFAAAALAFVACSKEKPPEPKAEVKKAEPPKPVEPPVELKAKWQVGKRYLFRADTVASNQITAATSPQPVQQEMNQSHDIAVTVLGQQDAGYAMEVEYTAIKTETRMATRTLMSFDSTSDPKTDRTNQIGSIQRKMLNHPYKLITDASGQPDKIEGYDDFIKKITSGGSRQAQTMLKAYLSADNLKKIPVFSHLLTGKTVKIGENWKSDSDFTSPLGAFKLSQTTTFKAWEQRDGHKVALLDITGVVVSPALAATPAAPGGAAAPIPATSGSPAPGSAPASAAAVPGQIGTLTGKAWYDPDQGAIVESVTDHNLNLHIATSSVQSHLIVTVKLNEVKDAPPKTEPKPEPSKTEAPK